MPLKADREGFLQGDPITIDRGSFGRAIALWQSIKKDIGDIRESLVGGAPRAPREPKSASSPVFTDSQVSTVAKSIVNGMAQPNRRREVELPMRGADGRFMRAPVPEVNKAAAPADRREVALPQRGRNGRFQKNPDAPDESPPEDVPEKPGNNQDRGKFAEGLKDSVKSGVGEALSGTEQIDPAIAASKEVGGMLGAIFKPAGFLMNSLRGKDKDEEATKVHVPWYKKIHKQLKDLTDRTGGGSGSSGGMFSAAKIGGTLLKVTGLATIGTFLMRGLVGAVGLFKPLGALAVRALPIIQKALPTFTKFAVKMAAPLAGIIAAVRGMRTSTEEYAARMGVELNGSLSQELGVRFVGVMGDLGNTLTLGLADKFGKVVAPEIISSFAQASEWIKSTWTTATDKLASAGDWIKEKWEGIKGAATSAKDRVESAVDSVMGAVGIGPDANKRALMLEMESMGMTNPAEQAMFMAQMGHETGGFRQMEESFKYGSADQLMAVSGSARIKGRSAVEQARLAGPVAMAELMYGGRMGNAQRGDAYAYRGRGFAQLTGRANYKMAGEALGIDLLNNPDLAADPANAAKIASWYWKSKGVSSAAKAGDVEAVTRMINGGTNGLRDRNAQFSTFMSEARSGAFSAVQAPNIGTLRAAQSAAPAIERYNPPAAPSVPTPIGSNDRGGNRTEVTIPLQIGQNVGDRAIAHVATGGMASGMGN